MSETSSSPNHCPRCGTALPDAPGGLCPRCLMAHIVLPTQVDGPAAAQAPIAPEELAPLFPQLEILECLGRGGMGVVYKARQKSLNRLVALKLLAPERAGDAGFAARFAREAQALAALNHPNIVSVYDFGEAGGFFFLLMEFVDGVNLRQLLRTKRLTPKEALSIVPPVCDALQCAHDHGIVHRDIKPENLLLDRHGAVKIADFGIAKIVARHSDVETTAERDSTLEPERSADRQPEAARRANEVSQSRATFAFGTPAYAAPEQRRANGAADHRADIYSLGVVLYEMLTGERPKDRLEPPSRRVQLDVRIDEIVLRALETSPELRFATAAEFRTRVDAVRNGTLPARSRWKTALKTAAVFAALLLLARVFLIEPVTAMTEAAAPELRTGSRCLVWKLPLGYSPGDIVVFRKTDGNHYLGRVVHDDGEVLTISREGEAEAVVARSDMTGKVIGNTRATAAPPVPATPADPMAEAIAQLDETMSSLLAQEKEQALDAADPGPSDAPRQSRQVERARIIQGLEQRMSSLEQQIQSLAGGAPASP